MAMYHLFDKISDLAESIDLTFCLCATEELSPQFVELINATLDFLLVVMVILDHILPDITHMLDTGLVG